jgi:glutamate/tyrosine decarboxylase-like PLP-dependent enzyme
MAGSTVMGGFDDHNLLNEIAKKYGLWHHVDACWGGSLAWSKKRDELFKGIEKVDSVSINAHKGFGVPSQCAMLVTNKKTNALRASNTSGADYLFHESEYSRYDIGDKTLSCGRKPDGFKFWLWMKRHGFKEMHRLADAALAKTEYITEQLKAQPEKFEMMNEPMGTNICFWYTPRAFRGVEYSDEHKTAVHKLIFERMQEHGTVLIQHNPLPEFNLPNFFRLTLKSENSTIEDMDYVLESIDKLGGDITAADL